MIPSEVKELVELAMKNGVTKEQFKQWLEEKKNGKLQIS
jgi:post-segregation antitoxin (ccd killing protein)